MKRQLLTILLGINFISIYAPAQTIHQAESFTLSSEIQGSHVYEAKDSINMVGGFHYTASSNDFFHAKINPTLVIPPEGGENGGPGPNDDGLVGTMPSNHQVTETGAFVYTVPIEVPPGINGLKPKVKMVYNSQSGEGSLGIGWNLNGSSAITRIGENYLVDGKKTGVDLDGDKYSMGGQRLIAVNGGYGEDGTEYRTEIASQKKIVSYKDSGFNGDGPQKFKVYGSDGNIYYYGYNDNSQLNAQTDESVLQWHLTKIEDRKGNYIRYEYINDDEQGRMVLKKIMLFNKLDEELYRIVMHFTAYSNTNEVYLSGNKVSGGSYVPTDITVEQNGNIYRHYNAFLQDDDLDKPYLKNITLSSNNKHLNKTEFEWNDDPEVLSYDSLDINTSFYANGNNYSTMNNYTFGDFNGDSKTDFLINYYHVIDNNFFKYDTSICYVKKDQGYYPEWVDSYLQGNDDNTNILRNIAGELNGDGGDDFVRISWRFIPQDEHPMDRDTTLKKATVFLNESNYIGFSQENNRTWVDNDNNMQFRLIDIDGDGIKEFLKIDFPGIEVYEMPGFTLKSSNTFNDLSAEDKSRFIVRDFNADGKEDIIRLSNDGIQTWGYSDAAEGLDSIYFDGFPTRYHSVYFGDYNGDGREDILTYGDENGWRLHLNAGNGPWADQNKWWHEIECPITRDEDPGEDDYDNMYYSLDMNGDGKTDIVEMYKVNDDENLKLNIYESKGIGFHKNEFEIDEDDYVDHQKNDNRFMDVNGDAQMDLLMETEDSSPQQAYLFKKKNKANLIHRVINPMDDTLTLEHTNLMKSGYEYDEYYNDENYQPLIAPLNVVSSVKVNNNEGAITTNYDYNYGIIHNQGRGFMGFRELIVEKPKQNNKKEIYKQLHPDHALLLNDVSYTYYTKTNKKLRSRQTTYDILTTNESDNHIILQPTVSETRKWDLNNNFISLTRKENIASIPGLKYGQIDTTKILTSEQDDNSYEFKTIKSFEYAPVDETNWVINRKTKVTTEYLRDNTDKIIRVNETEYYDENHEHYPLPKRQYIQPGDSLEIVKLFDYDSFGNTKSVSKTAPYSNLPARIKTLEYGAEYKHRFMTQQTVENGQNDLTTVYVRHPFFGHKLKETGPNGLTTKYEYDAFNRRIKTIHPDKTESAQVLRWVQPGDADAPATALYYKWSQSSGTGWNKQYYNKDGEKIRNVSLVHNGNKVYSDIKYDDIGRKDSVSLPYYANETPKYTVFAYDDLGRKIEKNPPDQAKTTYTYDGKETTVNGPGIYKTKTVNAKGWTVQTEDEQNRVVHEYYSDGNRKSSVLNDDNATKVSMEYDIHGNRTKLVDPSAGTIIDKYNPFGERTYHKDNKGHETYYKYDKLGRVTEIDNEYHTITKQYDTRPNGLGKLSKVSTANHQMEYYYDEQGRVQKKTETIMNNDPVSVEYTYDEFSRRKIITYPEDLVLYKSYDDVGNLEKIRNVANDNILWLAKSRDEHGSITEFKYGNDITTYKTFYEESHLPKSIFDENEEIINFTYQWYDDHNLKNRKDLIFDREEYFIYDELNRLESMQVVEGGASEPPVIIKYDKYGNIDSKGNFGVYDYDPNNNPYAVKEVDVSAQELHTLSHDISYNELDKTASITQDNGWLNLDYGIDEQRIKQTKNIDDETETHYYYGEGINKIVESSGDKKTKIYLTAPGGAFAIYVKPENKEGYFHYLHKDYQGSIMAVTSGNGDVQQHKRYDPWGVRKDPVTWDTDFLAGGSITARGYTMHEHLDDFGLINMNGRIYDPLLGRFLSPDNNIQAPGNPQNYNRYSYALNNPLKYTDPSGEVPMFAIVAAAYANAAIQITSGNVNNGWEFFGAAAVGAASGYAGGAAFQTVGTALGTANSFGGAMANGVISGAAGSGAGGFVSGAGNAWMNGASFSQGLNAGFSMAAKGMISGGIIGGITGGIGHGLNNRIQNKTFFSGEHKDHGLLAYQYTVDANSGAINRISDLGGAKTHFYHVGYATDMPPAFVQTMAQAIVVDGENTINSFRIWQSLNANISAFSIPNAGVTGYFLEPNGPSTTMRNTGRRIPGGTYKLTPNNASYPNDFIVYNDKVPADRGITIHQGAYPDHTEGCLIPGAKWSSTEPAVYYSTDKLPQIRSFINESGYRNVRLNIYYAF